MNISQRFIRIIKPRSQRPGSNSIHAYSSFRTGEAWREIGDSNRCTTSVDRQSKSSGGSVGSSINSQYAAANTYLNLINMRGTIIGITD